MSHTSCEAAIAPKEAASQLVWLIAGSSYATLAIFAALFGVSYGGFISLSPGFLAELFGAEQLGGLTGVNYSAAGFGMLVGPTFGAWLVDRTGSYTATIVTALIAGATATSVLAVLVRATRGVAPARSAPLAAAASVSD